MPNETPDDQQRRLNILRIPLFRLLAINLAAGAAAAALLVGGLLTLNPFGLRDLIFADNSPGIALGLLLFGFIVTFGSSAMGSAIMAMGKRQEEEDGPRGMTGLVVVTKPQSSDKNGLRYGNRYFQRRARDRAHHGAWTKLFRTILPCSGTLAPRQRYLVAFVVNQRVDKIWNTGTAGPSPVKQLEAGLPDLRKRRDLIDIVALPDFKADSFGIDAGCTRARKDNVTRDRRRKDRSHAPPSPEPNVSCQRNKAIDRHRKRWQENYRKQH
jgi:hypothetical protein